MSFPRYPKYKESGVEWLGEVPEHWEVQRLKHMAARIPYAIVDGPFGTQLKADDYRPSGVPLVRISNLSFTGKFLEDDLVFIEDSKAEDVSRSTVRRGDVVIGKTGATIGKSALFDYSVKGVIASSCLKISPDPDAVSSAFLGRIIESDGFQKTLLNESGGSTRDTINITPFGNLAVVLPPLAEQLPICRFLDRETAKIDALIAEQQRLIELLQEKRQAVISHAITKGLNPDAQMKESGIEWLGEVPRHWKTSRLKHASAKIVDCPHETPTYSDDGEYLVIRTPDLNDGCLLTEGMNRVDHAEYTDRTRREILQTGDIVYSREGGRWGHAATVPEDERFCLGQRMMQFRASEDWAAGYLMWHLTSRHVYAQGEVDTAGAASPHVNVGTISNYRLAHPPLDEQSQIARVLGSLAAGYDNLMNQAQNAITLLQERRSALISAAVTGQIDVRGLASSEAA